LVLSSLLSPLLELAAAPAWIDVAVEDSDDSLRCLGPGVVRVPVAVLAVSGSDFPDVAESVFGDVD
jgi:hypothetical protein